MVSPRFTDKQQEMMKDQIRKDQQSKKPFSERVRKMSLKPWILGAIGIIIVSGLLNSNDSKPSRTYSTYSNSAVESFFDDFAKPKAYGLTNDQLLQEITSDFKQFIPAMNEVNKLTDYQIKQILSKYSWIERDRIHYRLQRLQHAYNLAK